jgi:serine/threonine protein kinase
MTPHPDGSPVSDDQLMHERELPDQDRSDEPVPSAHELSPGSAIDATIAHDSAAARSSKEECDLAFAVVALQSGQLNPRQMARAVESWTIHGHRPLAEHLVNQGLIGQEDRQQLEKIVFHSLLDPELESQDGASLRERVGTNMWERVCRMLGVAGTADADRSDEPRSMVSEFAIVRRLGMGGLGSVWLARDQSLNRLVAIKEIGDQAAGSPVALARFRREAEITGQLEHPNIVPVYESGQDIQRRHPFYVMRFVGKKTLADAISEYHARREAGVAEPVELHRLLNSFLSVCQAVAYAHSRNVLHRDLKPENIALGSFGQVIVLDWGLAKRTNDGDWYEGGALSGTSGGSTVERTMAGQVLGTPHYMSPEQAAGRIDSMDERTDVYGLGATLFAILTGCAPHEASQLGSTRSTRGAQLYAAIVENPTPRVRSVAPHVPEALESICAKAMAGPPAARYQTASELAEDLQRWMAGEPISAFKERWTRRFPRWARKHRGLSLLFASLVTFLLILLSFLAYTSNQRHAALERGHMESLYLDGKELSLNIRGTVEEAAKNVRFMSTMPPIQAIIGARQKSEADTEVVEHGRLETIFAGLMRAKAEYLALSYVDLSEEGKRLVRVERSRSDRSLIYAVPRVRLAELPADASERSVNTLSPGDVDVSDLLATDYASSPASAADTIHEPLTLTFTVPVFAETSGELFGAVTLEVDLEYLLGEWLRDLNAKRVTLIDRHDSPIASFLSEGIRDQLVHEHATSVLPTDFIASAENELRRMPDATHPRGLYALKVHFDPQRIDRFICLVLEG